MIPRTFELHSRKINRRTGPVFALLTPKLAVHARRPESPAFTIETASGSMCRRNAALICSTVSAWILASRSASHLNGRSSCSCDATRSGARRRSSRRPSANRVRLLGVGHFSRGEAGRVHFFELVHEARIPPSARTPGFRLTVPVSTAESPSAYGDPRVRAVAQPLAIRKQSDARRDRFAEHVVGHDDRRVVRIVLRELETLPGHETRALALSGVSIFSLIGAAFLKAKNERLVGTSSCSSRRRASAAAFWISAGVHRSHDRKDAVARAVEPLVNFRASSRVTLCTSGSCSSRVGTYCASPFAIGLRCRSADRRASWLGSVGASSSAHSRCVLIRSNSALRIRRLLQDLRGELHRREEVLRRGRDAGGDALDIPPPPPPPRPPPRPPPAPPPPPTFTCAFSFRSSSWICWRVRLFVPAISRPPANDAASLWPASVVRSPNRKSIVADDDVVGGLLREHRHLHAVGEPRSGPPGCRCSRSSGRTTRRDHRDLARVVAQRGLEVRRGRHDGAVGRRVGLEVAHRPVGRLEIRLHRVHRDPRE